MNQTLIREILLFLDQKNAETSRKSKETKGREVKRREVKRKRVREGTRGSEQRGNMKENEKMLYVVISES